MAVIITHVLDLAITAEMIFLLLKHFLVGNKSTKGIEIYDFQFYLLSFELCACYFGRFLPHKLKGK